MLCTGYHSFASICVLSKIFKCCHSCDVNLLAVLHVGWSWGGGPVVKYSE